MTQSPSGNGEYALIVAPEGRTNPALVRQLMLLLNYRYGLDLVVAKTFLEGFSTAQRYGRRILCTAAVLGRKTDSRTSLSGLNLEGQLPLFLAVPAHLRRGYEDLCHRLEDVWFITWEEAQSPDAAGSLRKTVEHVFEERGIGEIFSEANLALPYAQMQERVAHRIRNVKTLPTLPEVAMRIMAMVDDPEHSVAELEEVLTSDPAIVHKLIQVVNSPLFAGSGHKGGWSLHDAIVRLGRKQVGAIAQQIKLMNTLVKPEASLFDLRRFWEHSVACAVVADRLVRGKLLPLDSPVAFNDYWIGALLHDVGKLVLAFFFFEHFEDLVTHMAENACTFREAEKATGDVANHELLGRLLLVRAHAGEPLVEAVGTHHTAPRDPSDLVCLIHLADQLAKELGFGYLEDEARLYSSVVVQKLDLDRAGLVRLRSQLGDDLPDEIRALVERCTT